MVDKINDLATSKAESSVIVDGLEDGTCRCGNRFFFQSTMVEFSEKPLAFVDEGGRYKKEASGITKIYMCTYCDARYVHRKGTEAWVTE